MLPVNNKSFKEALPMFPNLKWSKAVLLMLLANHKSSKVVNMSLADKATLSKLEFNPASTHQVDLSNNHNYKLSKEKPKSLNNKTEILSDIESNNIFRIYAFF